MNCKITKNIEIFTHVKTQVSKSTHKTNGDDHDDDDRPFCHRKELWLRRM